MEYCSKSPSFPLKKRKLIIFISLFNIFVENQKRKMEDDTDPYLLCFLLLLLLVKVPTITFYVILALVDSCLVCNNSRSSDYYLRFVE